MAAHVSAHDEIAFHVIVAGDNVSSPACDGRFEHHIIIRIAADRQATRNRSEDRARREQAEQISDLAILELVFLLEPRTAQHVGEFFDEWQ